MNWIARLEKKFGRYAIRNLMFYLMALYLAGFILVLVNPSFYYDYLALNPEMVMKGQVWRLVTFLIQPPSSDILYFLLYMYLYYILGTTLERAWGSFTFDLYIVIGILGHILGAMVVYWVTGYNGAPFYYDLHYLYMSLFLAFALTFPEMEFLLFFLVPIKAKYLALIDLVVFGYGIIMGSMSSRIVAILSLINFVLFALTLYKGGVRDRAKQAARKADFAHKMRQGEREAIHRGTGGSRHRCAVCGRTELTNPELEFRYCSQCDGAYEYCMDHLYTHIHVTKNAYPSGSATPYHAAPDETAKED